jgi:transposase
LTTKIHGAVNDDGKAVKLKLTAGQINDVTQADSMLEGLKPEHVIGDKAYDSDDLRSTIRKSGAKPVIPSRKGIRRRRYDKNLYKKRNIIERFFNRIKHYRRIATRYDKTDTNFL